jgi:hypothetical protein
MPINSYPLVINGGSNNNESVVVDSDGFTHISKLVLIDSKDGTKWDFSIHVGEVLVEPHGKSEKREFRIDKVIS